MSSKHRNWIRFTLPSDSPCDVFVGFTAADQAFICREIQRATDGPWGHVLVGFRWPDGSACYFEALLGDGVTGPWPIERLTSWNAESKMHRLALVDIPRSWLPNVGLRPALGVAIAAIGRQSYSAPQLLAMGLFERYGLPMLRSETRTVCSEFAAYVLEGIVDLRDRRRIKLDQVNPNSAWRRLCEELAGLGSHTRRNTTQPSEAEGVQEAILDVRDGAQSLSRAVG